MSSMPLKGLGTYRDWVGCRILKDPKKDCLSRPPMPAKMPWVQIWRLSLGSMKGWLGNERVVAADSTRLSQFSSNCTQNS